MRKTAYIALWIALPVFVFSSCNLDQPAEDAYIVDINARDFTFEMQDSILSGWVTFQFNNLGHAEHFFLLSKLPDTISYQNYLGGVTMPFSMVFDSLKAGMSKADAGALLGELIPPWYFTGVQLMGGSGIVSSTLRTESFLNLTPGTYVVECYIKEKGVFHTELGMIRPLHVRKDSSGMEPPEAGIDLTLTNFAIKMEGTPVSGLNTVAVHFKEHPEAGPGNDVHVIEIDESTNLDSVIYWLDWMNVRGLEAPAPVKFLGGVQEMPVGYTAYFNVELEQGEYAWIAESTSARGTLLKFSVE